MKSKSTAAILAFFLGGIGAHKFYLGQTVWGLLYLFFFWTFIPTLVAFIEFFVLLLMDQQSFDARFNFHAMMLRQGPQGPANQIAQSVVVNVPNSAEPPAHAPERNLGAQLAELNDLRISGALTDQEFEVQKSKLLNA